MDHERTQEKEYEQDRSVVSVLSVDAMWLYTDYRIYGNTEVSGREVESLAAERKKIRFCLEECRLEFIWKRIGVLVLDVRRK